MKLRKYLCNILGHKPTDSIEVHRLLVFSTCRYCGAKIVRLRGCENAN